MTPDGKKLRPHVSRTAGARDAEEWIGLLESETGQRTEPGRSRTALGRIPRLGFGARAATAGYCRGSGTLQRGQVAGLLEAVTFRLIRKAGVSR